MSAAMWLDMVMTSGRFWAGWLLAMLTGVGLLALGERMDSEYDTDWCIVPMLIGFTLVIGYNAAAVLGILARLAVYVFTGA